MSLEQSEIIRIAELARVRIADSEIEEVTERISDILEMVDRMRAVDTAAIEPMTNPLDAGQRLRADEVTETNQRDTFQRCAPAVENGLYLVPRVVE